MSWRKTKHDADALGGFGKEFGLSILILQRYTVEHIEEAEVWKVRLSLDLRHDKGKESNLLNDSATQERSTTN